MTVRTFLISVSFPVLILVSASCSKKQDLKSYTHFDETPLLNLYYPDFDRIEMQFGEPPSFKDTSVIFCCLAAFTEKRLPKFSHDNIGGPYIDGGKVYSGFDCTHNTGYFVFYDGHWSFSPLSDLDAMRESAAQGGMGFSQIMIIPPIPHDIKEETIWESSGLKLYRNEKNALQFRRKRHYYRALCEKDGRLCIAELKKKDTYSFFRHALSEYGFDKAIYLDTGFGWSYSWYRDARNRKVTLHSYRHPYSNNWLVFKRG